MISIQVLFIPIMSFFLVGLLFNLLLASSIAPMHKAQALSSFSVEKTGR